MSFRLVEPFVKRMLLLLLIALLPGLAPAAELETVLANMDQASQEFQSMKADVQRVNYTAIVDDKSVETGQIWVRRQSKEGVSLLMKIEEPYPVYVSVDGTKAEIYRPKIAQVEEYDLSESKDVLEQAFALGFGTAGSFLVEHYKVSLQEEEQVANQSTVKLELIPKSEEVLKRTPEIEIWVSTENWQAVQQKMYEANSGDYRMNTYTNLVLNPDLKDADLRLQIPRGVKRVYPQR